MKVALPFINSEQLHSGGKLVGESKASAVASDGLNHRPFLVCAVRASIHSAPKYCYDAV